jgi:hypothetical protein
MEEHGHTQPELSDSEKLRKLIAELEALVKDWRLLGVFPTQRIEAIITKWKPTP